MSHSHEVLQTIPPATMGIIGICGTLFLLQIVLDFDLNQVTFCPRLVIYLHEFYRIVSSSLFHASFMHIGMNMMSTMAISTMLEKHLGTLRLILTTLWSILLTSFVYMVAALFLSSAFGYDELMYQHSVGFSGVLFHMSVLECNVGSHPSRSFFGMVRVPSYLYPWVLLFVLQFIMPNLSFMGHLSGIITGTLQLYGFLDSFAMVDQSYLLEMEEWQSLGWLTSRPNFVRTPSSDETGVLIHRGPSSLWHSLRNGVCSLVVFVRNVGETLKVIVFGRGREANANVQLGEWTSSSLASAFAIEDDDDDEDWAGLPPEAERSDII